MQNINLTVALERNEAIVLDVSEICPDRYIEIAGAGNNSGEASIAIPKELLVHPELVERLKRQAITILRDFFGIVNDN